MASNDTDCQEDRPQLTLHKSQGILRYSIEPNVGYKLIVEVDREISNYYRSLIPKYIDWLPQKYPPHISVVRHETPPNLEAWDKYDGEKIEFEYPGIIYSGTVYWWLNAFSERLEEIRVELGLPISSMYTRPPEGFDKVFHITLANRKHEISPVQSSASC